MISLFDSDNTENFLEKYLLVEISNEKYAFQIEYVKEIIPIIDMFSLDTEGNNVTGLLNFRGETIPVYDLRGFLGKEISQLNIKQKFLILDIDDKKLAVIIDNVDDIISIKNEDITEFDYNDTINFLKTTVIENATVVIIDINNFYNYTKIAKNVNKVASTQLTSTEPNALAKVQNRIALLNKKNNYEIKNENFLNEKFIIFKLNNEVYAFNITYVKEIKKIHVENISKIPCPEPFIIGIMNFRGDYISLLDVKPFLNILQTPLNDKINTIILSVNNLKLAIMVDEILDVTNISITDMALNTDQDETYIIGDLPYINNRLNVLNIEKLFSSENITIENYE